MLDPTAAPTIRLDPFLPNHPVTAFHRRRPLFWLALAFCAGIAADAILAPALPTLGGLALAAFLATLIVLFRKVDGSPVEKDVNSTKIGGAKRPVHYAVCALGLSLACGALTHALRARIAPGDDVSRRTSALPSFVILQGTLIEAGSRGAPRATPPGMSVPPAESLAWTVAVEAIGPDASALTPASGRVRLTLRPGENPGAAEAKEGARIECRARLEAPPELTLPDTFDYSAYLQSQNIRRVGAVFPRSLRIVSGAASWWRVDLLLRGFSSTLARRVESTLAGWETAGRQPGSQAALLNALLFGRREHVDVSDRDAFAASGAAHLLAISGLQIQFLAVILWQAAAYFGWPRRKAAWAVLALSAAYCALAGGDPPVMRATVMIALYLIAVLAYREPDPLSVLGASALAILFFAPGELFNAGFQLTFLAVLSLVTVYPALEDAWAEWRRSREPALLLELPETVEPGAAERWLGYLRIALFVTLAAWLGTAPVVAWHMGRFATLSLAVNLVAVPLSDLCMVLGIAMLLVGVVSAVLAQAVALSAFGSLVALQGIVEFFAAMPGASIDLPPPAWPLLMAYGAVLFWIWRERGRGNTLGRQALLLGACLLALNAGLLFREPPAAASVTILDVPRGRSALVESASGGAALLDAGGFGDGARIAEMLRRRGISRLAMLVISAEDPEAIDGAAELLKHVPAARVMLPRGTSAGTARRELESFLSAAQIPYGSPDTMQPVQGPGEIRWDFCDDGAAPGEKTMTQSALCVRVSVPGGSGRENVLFLAARSDAALKRLRQNARTRASLIQNDMLQAGVVRVTPGQGGAWPGELEAFIAQSNCSAVIAGSRGDPEESGGLNLAVLVQSRGLRLLWPQRDGTLRIQADVGARMAQTLQAFREGVWRDVP